jgi:hypothetical protein
MDGVRSDVDDSNLCHNVLVYCQKRTIDTAINL